MGTRGNFSRCMIQIIHLGRGLSICLRNCHFQPAATLLTHVSPRLTTAGAGILNQLSIAYALRPQLRSRLTLGGRTFPRKPWVYGGQEFNLSYRYSCLHPHFRALHGWFPYRFTAPRTLSYHALESKFHCIRSFGIPLDRQSFSAPSLSMSQLLRTV